MENITKLTSIKGGKSDAQSAIDNLRKEMPEILEMIALKAELQSVHYDECIKQGFNEDQALELCKHFSLASMNVSGTYG